MGLAKFPQGMANYGVPILGGLIATGNVYFVHAGIGTSNNAGTDPDRPLATIDQAINKCTAASSSYAGEDLIMVLPGHVETISAATTVMDLDVAGVHIIGLGSGSIRPTITLSDADNPFDIGANGVSVANLLLVAGVDSLAAAIDIDASTGVLLEALEFRDASSIGIVDTVDIADETDVTLRNCRWYETDTGIGQSCILGTTPTRLVIEGCRFYKDAQTGIIEMGNAVDLFYQDLYIETIAPEDLACVFGATATGWINDLYIRLNDDAANITECMTANTDIQCGPRVFVINADAESPLALYDIRGQNTYAASTDA